MPASPYDLRMHTSGLGSLANPELSLGGQIGVLLEQSFSAGIPGVAVVNGRGLANTPGTVNTQSTLRWRNTHSTLEWQGANDAGFGSPIVVAADGRYAIPEDGSGQLADGGRLIVDIVAANLPLATTVLDASSTIQDGNTSGRFFGPVVDTFEQETGFVRYRCFYIENTHPTDPINTITMHIHQQPVIEPGGTVVADALAVSVDPNGAGDGSTTGVALVIGDEVDTTNILSSLVFTAPTVGAPLAVGSLTAGQRIGIWFRQTVTANNFTLGSVFQEARVAFGFTAVFP